MKRKLLCIVCFVLLFSLCACSAREDDASGESPAEESVVKIMTQDGAVPETTEKEASEAAQVQTEAAETEKIETDSAPDGSGGGQDTVWDGDETVSWEGTMEEGSSDVPDNQRNITDADTAKLRSFLDSLTYRSYTCDGLPEYVVSFDDGVTYQVNISSRWVWKDKEKEADLSEEQLAELWELLGIE